jgi:hypothetical protein
MLLTRGQEEGGGGFFHMTRNYVTQNILERRRMGLERESEGGTPTSPADYEPGWSPHGSVSPLVRRRTQSFTALGFLAGVPLLVHLSPGLLRLHKQSQEESPHTLKNKIYFAQYTNRGSTVTTKSMVGHKRRLAVSIHQ